MTIRYYHSDSSPLGSVDVDTLRRKYDGAGRLVVEANTYGGITKNKEYEPKISYYIRYLDYTAQGDTLITRVATIRPIHPL
jgi:YD repeat-containing protein